MLCSNLWGSRIVLLVRAHPPCRSFRLRRRSPAASAKPAGGLRGGRGCVCAYGGMWEEGTATYAMTRCAVLQSVPHFGWAPAMSTGISYLVRQAKRQPVAASACNGGWESLAYSALFTPKRDHHGALHHLAGTRRLAKPIIPRIDQADRRSAAKAAAPGRCSGTREPVFALHFSGFRGLPLKRGEWKGAVV